MMQFRLSNDRTEVDIHALAAAFGLSRDALHDALRLGTISYCYELEPGDTATPRTVFRSTETGQCVTLDRVGRIISAEENRLVDQPVPCKETCRSDGGQARAADTSTPISLTEVNRQTAQHASAPHLNNLLDEALRETFPASDPVAISFDSPYRGI
ncbi:DUF6522 family protein [Citreimonas salinaria]|uniref:DUF6522 family protein n=1 Tax=Citreimonas salinaria TaxID=321339 RepID=UPI000B0D27AF|nr:DUF6522 family protein [Citreimonas salinaria]